MTAPDFSARSEALELMDDPLVGGAELAQTLDELELVNRFLGGYRTSLAAVESLLPRGCARFSLLDVGTGGGDAPRRIADWSRGRGIAAEIRGIDLSEETVGRARGLSRDYAELSFERRDLFDLPAGKKFDIVHSALVLHHIPGDRAAEALRRMFELCRWGLVVNDLHRHPAAYYSIKALTALLSSNRLIRHDAPLSVLRAFRRSCLEELARKAGLPKPEIRWRWAFRWQMVVRR